MIVSEICERFSLIQIGRISGCILRKGSRIIRDREFTGSPIRPNKSHIPNLILKTEFRYSYEKNSTAFLGSIRFLLIH